MRSLSRNVTRWRDGQIVERCAAVCFLEAEKGWRKVQGYRDLWILRQALGWLTQAASVELPQKAA